MRIARWTIGPVSQSGFECLKLSIASFLLHHDAKPVVCYNCGREQLDGYVPSNVTLFDQTHYCETSIPPKGVAWKLYPPRLYPDDHELCIDNDIVFLAAIPEIDIFYKGDCTLLLEGNSRHYGRFESHVPPGYRINSGVYGMPPGFNFQKYINFHVRQDWEENAYGIHAASKTFDEQGIVATSLLSNDKFVIIPEESLTNCQNQLIPGKALHFVSLNRNKVHEPFRLFKSTLRKMYL